MTGQSLLDRMEVVNAELQLQAGEADVTKGLVALNIAQDYFESLAAVQPGILGSQHGTVSTTANGETTAYPAGLLRIDKLQLLSGSEVVGDIDPLQRAGGHAGGAGWPYSLFITSGVGAPVAYWSNGTYFYWSPKPDTVYTVRWYGFKAAADITASGTFAYPDVVSFPLASFAARLLKTGIDDNASDVGSLAQESFKSTLDTLSMFNRDGAVGYNYTRVHSE